MKKILLLGFTLTFYSVFGQIDFNEYIVSSTSTSSNSIRSIASMDINGDNKVDIVTVSEYDNKITWFKNLNGEDKFSQEIIINANATRVNYVQLFDIDNDGDIDILSGSAYDTKIVWYENIDGLGDFSNEQIISNNQGKNILAADLDNDGDLDILATDDYNNLLIWFENLDGFGNFSTEQTILPNTYQVFDISINDIDNDGDNDIILASSNKLIWHENLDGNVNFSSENIIFENDTYNMYQYKVHSADIDSDGNIDIITTNTLSELSWVKNDGFGNFGSKQIISNNTSISYSKLSDLVKDIDGDNFIDILILKQDGLTWFKNTNGLGDFIEQTSIENAEPNSNIYLLSDINSNNDFDIISVNYIENDYVLRIIKNTDGLGNFDNDKIINSASVFFQNVNTVDFNFDGNIDIVTSADFITSVYKKDEYGIFRQEILEKVFDNDPVSSDFTNIFDVDNDGDLDMVSVEYEYSLGWFQNINNILYYTLIEDSLYDLKKSYYADIDDDGWTDIIAVGSYNIYWFKNYYGSSFIRQDIVSNFNSLYNSIDINDLDNDGDLDIVSVSSDDNKIAWYENTDGLGAFSSENIISSNALGATDVKTEDIDNDGTIDIITTSANDNEICWYKNLDNLGNFTKNIITNNANGITFIQVGDIDNDGDLDIISSSKENTTVYWYENTDSEGSFGTEQIINNTILHARYLYITDINNDGKLDIISSSSEEDNNNNKLSLFKNLGQNTNSIGDVNNNILGFSIYPNPTKFLLNIKSKTEIVKIEIYSKLGQLIKETTENKIDISNLTQGLYFVKVEDVNGNFGVKKVVKK